MCVKRKSSTTYQSSSTMSSYIKAIMSKIGIYKKEGALIIKLSNASCFVGLSRCILDSFIDQD